jgi:hypothetical protein
VADVKFVSWKGYFTTFYGYIFLNSKFSF